jgi:hypothetical protein
MLRAHRLSFILLLLLFMYGCSSSSVMIHGNKIHKSKLAYLKIGNNTAIISINGKNIPKRGPGVRIHGYWMAPGTITVGAIYTKISNNDIKFDYTQKKRIHTWTEETSKETQYANHFLKAGKKYYVVMNRKHNNTATAAIIEAGNHKYMKPEK